MNRTDQLAELLAMQYEVRVRRTDKGFMLGIPELGLVSRHASLEQGHAQLMQARDELLTEMVREGLADWIVPPGGAGSQAAPQAGASQAQSLKPFFIKMGAVLALLLAVGIGVGNVLASLGSGLERDVNGIREWPDSKVLKYRDNARETMVRLKPILDELVLPFQQQPDKDARK